MSTFDVIICNLALDKTFFEDFTINSKIKNLSLIACDLVIDQELLDVFSWHALKILHIDHCDFPTVNLKIDYGTTLEVLSVTNCELDKITLQFFNTHQENPLKFLNLSNNVLTNFSFYKNIIYIDCSTNRMTEIDLNLTTQYDNYYHQPNLSTYEKYINLSTCF